MKLKNLLLFLALAVAVFSIESNAYGQANKNQKEIYKSTVDCNGNTTDLSLTIVKSKSDSSTPTTALVLYHGGGWINGRPESMLAIANYFSQHGVTSFLVEYRLESTHGTTPYESLMDAKSAMRYIKANCEKFNIDPDKIVSMGASAGGHLASAINLCHEINDPADKLAGIEDISSSSVAQILYNPVVYNGPDKVGGLPGYANGNKANDFRVAEYWQKFSPYDNVAKGISPSLILLGSKDRLIPVEVAYGFQEKVKSVGGKCEVTIYEGEAHSFWGLDHKNKSAVNFAKTTRESHNFLKELGLIDGECTIETYIKGLKGDYAL